MNRPVGRVPDRIAWAVDLIGVRPNDQVLEFGCGPGIAVTLVCDRLGEAGKLTAIDRSATAIDRARSRNVDHLAAGRLALEHVDLAGFRSDAARFDKAFAVNVNVFWTGDAREECQVLRSVLRPGGAVHLIYEGPGPGGHRDIGPLVTKALEPHGFTTEVLTHETGRMICVTGRRTGM